MRIGTIGLGAMGAPMTRNLAREGDSVMCYDIDPEKVAALAADGTTPAASIAELAENCELVVTMISDDAALDAVIFGEQGLLSVPFKGCAIDISTTSATIARRCAAAIEAQGGRFLDGAVIGGGAPAATAGTSPIVVSGDHALFERYASRLARLGHCDFVGELGNAKIVKIINNMLVGIITASNAEALSLGMAAGMDLTEMVEGLKAGSGSSTVLASYMGRYVEQDSYGVGLIGHRLMAKDMSLACQLADETAFPAHFAELARQLYMWSGSALGENRMFPSVFELFQRDTGHPFETPGA